MLVLIKGHNSRAAHQLIAHRYFLNIMASQLNPVLAAPIIDLLRKVIQHQPLHCLPIFVTESAISLCFYKQKSYVIQNILTKLGAEIICHHGGIGRMPPLVLRLICKKSHNFLGKLFTEPGLVCIVGQCQKLIRHSGVQNIRRGYSRMHRHIQMGLAGNGFLCTNQAAVIQIIIHSCCRIKISDAMGQIPIPILCVFQKLAAGKATGPAVFIIDPGLHIARFLGAGLNALHPFLRKILSLQATASMHKEASVMGLTHPADLADQLFFFQLAIPRPKRNGLIFHFHGF